MDYRILLQEENDAVRERYELSMERIRSMNTEEMQLPYGCYFKKVSAFIRRIERLAKRVEETGLSREAGLDGALLTLEELREENHALYQDILPENYGESFANPDYAVEVLGDGYGQLLSFLYTEIRADIVYAFEMRLMNITILNELFLEIYNIFAQAWEEGRKAPQEQLIKDSLYWFVSDYAEVTVDWRIREGLDPALSFGTDIVMEQDLTDLRYLYAYGEYVSETEIKLASFMNSLPQETIDQMASTYTEGFRKGFQVMGRDLKKKRTVVVEFQLGFERMIRRAVEYFREMGLEPICYRAAVESVNRRANGRRGYYGTSPNKQYDYDHRYDSAVYMDKAFRDRKIGVLKTAYEQYKEDAAAYAGPAVIETFGESGFDPVNKPEAWAFTEKQQNLYLEYRNLSMPVVNEYIPGDETSFTIIAFPVPAIGEQFPEIFKETIRINTLDYELYRDMQQKIIDVLDTAEYVEITGKGENQTNMQVQLAAISNPEKQTKFENCVADVNIPLGEVFTSPKLAGTNGILNVGTVYIGDIQYRNLRMEFKDGRVVSAVCDNFVENGVIDQEAGHRLIVQGIMNGHETLPLGEFAIGTNTTAYAMAEKFGILDRLPILIVEKMGPHFAVGDTCYSWSEDSPMYNPDGKEMIARDNEVSILRKEDVSKAYFGVHTDITIPYKELERISAVHTDGTKTDIILDGRFVLAGLDELNRPLDEK